MSRESIQPTTTEPHKAIELSGLDSDPKKFIETLQETVTPEMLLQDRAAQAKLDYTLDTEFYQFGSASAHFDKPTRIQLKTPTLEMQRNDGSGASWIHSAFRLKEEPGDEHYYFFGIGYPSEESAKKFLRPQDIVPSHSFNGFSYSSETKQQIMDDLGLDEEQLKEVLKSTGDKLSDYPRISKFREFTKPLERAPINGGVPEQFNYVTNQWESTDEQCIPDQIGKHKPSLGRRLGWVLGVKI